MYVKENVNPKKRVTGDCVIRAITKAENKQWLDVYDELSTIARKNYTLPNNKDSYNEYLKKYEKINVYHTLKGKKKRYTVKEVSEWDGTYIISIANHMTMASNGNYYDLWDCGNRCAYVIWKVS
jgi:hypothetical protein